jgi:hypothetical protein
MSYGVDMVKIELYRSVDWVAQVAPKMTSAYVTNGNGNKVGSYAWTVPADIGTTPALAKSGGGSIPAVWGIKVRVHSHSTNWYTLFNVSDIHVRWNMNIFTLRTGT